MDRIEKIAMKVAFDWQERAQLYEQAGRDLGSLEELVEMYLVRKHVDYRRVEVGRPIGPYRELNIRVELRSVGQVSDEPTMLAVFDSCWLGFVDWSKGYGFVVGNYKQMKSYPKTLGITVSYK